MLQMQDSLLKASAKELLRTDLLHMTSKEQDLTKLELNSYVLVHYRSGSPPSRLHTFWRGPMQVISGDNPRYLLRDLVTHKEKEYHVSDMKLFNFDPSTTDPLDIARRDHLEFIVEKVFAHRGNLKLKKTSSKSHGSTTCQILELLPYGYVRLLLTKTYQKNRHAEKLEGNPHGYHR